MTDTLFTKSSFSKSHVYSFRNTVLNIQQIKINIKLNRLRACRKGSLFQRLAATQIV